MRLTIDKAGRITLPKAVRDEFGLNAGSVLELENTGDSIILLPVDEQPVVRKKNGLLVVSTPVDSTEGIVQQSRDERLDVCQCSQRVQQDTVRSY